MLRSISTRNFKLFKDKIVFDGLQRINLLTGINGRGKSTFLQFLLLPKQSMLINRQSMNLVLNGEYVTLGTALDVKNIKARRESPIEFCYCEDGRELSIKYSVDENQSQILVFEDVSFTDGQMIGRPTARSLEELCMQTGIALNRVSYVSAERIGPQLQYLITEVDKYVGAKGEYTVSQLHSHKSDALSGSYIEELLSIFPELNSEEVSTNLVNQVEFWMSRMFKETTIETYHVEDANILTLKISTVQHRGDRFKPTNVGFGYSYVLPIITAGLTSTPGDIIVIENPEAHLHPSAQAIMGRFLTVIANIGVQVFIETHSEHILNAFRVCVKQGHLNHIDLNVMFFEEENELFYRHVKVDGNGRIEEWPRFFYDQEEQDLDIIMS